MEKKYFTQNLNVDTEFKNVSRFDFFKPFVKDKNVLHVGFADFPITNIHENLHLKISSFCKKLDGVDLNLTDEIKSKLSVSNGNLYSSWDFLKDEYDIIIVPEVIEHVDNIRNFLELLDTYSGELIITAPDAYLLMSHFKEVEYDKFNFKEIVHPDHNCWFSPYTLKNVINKYSKKRQVKKLFWIKGSIVAWCN